MAVTTITRQPTAAFGEQMAKYLRLRKAESLVISPAAKQPMAITRLVSEIGLPERTESIPSEKAFVVSIHLTPASDRGCEVWVDDKHSRVTTWPSGGIGIYDLESNLRKRNPGPVDWVHYHIPAPHSMRSPTMSGGPDSKAFDASMEPWIPSFSARRSWFFRLCKIRTGSASSSSTIFVCCSARTLPEPTPRPSR